ncbi:MAG: alpha/beta fold hydrolase [Aeromicrobium sp.]
MSTPRSLEIPHGVEETGIETPVGTFAAHVVRVESPGAHVLLIPGWTGSKEDFTPLLPLLAAAGFDATAYDQRGQFETAGSTVDYTLDGFASDALAIASMRSTDPSHLLGHSFGGLVAQHALLAEPSAWRSLSLLDTGPGALGDSPNRPLRMLVDALGKVPLADIHRFREQATGAKRTPDIADFLLRRFTSNDPLSLKAMTIDLLDAPDRIDEVAALSAPVWVGRGADDDAWPHDIQASMAKRLGTEIHVIEDSAHSPAVENTQGLADAWLPFLTSI